MKIYQYKTLLTLVQALVLTSIYGQTTMPGTRVDLGGYELHVRAIGTGEKTIVIEPGTGFWSLQWMNVQNELAQHFRVITYDRAGYGWSDRSPYARTGENIVRELHLLLQKVGITEPIILLGHSYGGLVVRAYAKKYPDQVAGLILAESASENQFEKLPEIVNMILEGAKAQFRETGTLARSGLLKPNQMPIDSTLAKAHWQDYQQAITRSSYYDAMLNEMDLLPLTYLSSTSSRSFGMPLLVITADNSFGAFPNVPNLSLQACNDTWMVLQHDLLSRAETSEHRIIPGATHDLLLTAPEKLVKEVIDFVSNL